MMMSVILCREVVLFYFGGDQAVVLESYQLYSKSAPLCKRESQWEQERERREKWDKGREKAG